jgi:hypothetical protein
VLRNRVAFSAIAALVVAVVVGSLTRLSVSVVAVVTVSITLPSRPACALLTAADPSASAMAITMGFVLLIFLRDTFAPLIKGG